MCFGAGRPGRFSHQTAPARAILHRPEVLPLRPHPRGRVDNGEIGLGPGQVAHVTLVPAPGSYPVHCGHPFHKMLGMRSTIVVQ